MQLAIQSARRGLRQGHGGPFGACIVRGRRILATAHNTVLVDRDPTAHAEMNAIRQACRKLGTHDLSGCRLYSTAEPCPMCLGAIIWANIRTVIYGCRKEDAANIGFRDDFIYDFIKDGMKDKKVLSLEESDRDLCLSLFNEYSEKHKPLY